MSSDGKAKPQLHGYSAAENLSGRTIAGRWFVEKRLHRHPDLSGGTKSICYRARSADGQPHFLKVFDFQEKIRTGTTEDLERLVREYNHERKVHIHCADRRLGRVTEIRDAGTFELEQESLHFIVCEYAEGCLRSHQPPGDASVSTSDRLTALRMITSALIQLHQVGVAHQDIKPSNAVYFSNQIVKLADLGSASCLHLPAAPHDSELLVGQPNYAPYELHYGYTSNDSWERRRFGCDAFLLGNLIFTSFVGVSVTPVVLHGIPLNSGTTSIGQVMMKCSLISSVRTML